MPAKPTTAEHCNAHNTWVLPEHRVVYTHLAKNACTSLKWLVAELAGQQPEQFNDAFSAEATRRMLVHHRRLWHGVDSLQTADPALKAEISPDNGWFIFAVVRDPRLRAFSAWQSKFLVGDPVYTGQKYADADWLPRVPTSSDDVIRDFTRFVEVLKDPDGLIRDTHFATQTSRLHLRDLPYTRIYDVKELPELLADLGAHLDKVGRPHALDLGRENDTPLGPAGAVFEGVKDALDEIYRSDLEQFGHLWDFEPIKERPITWTKTDFRDIAARRSLGERITDLHRLAKAERRRANRLEKKVTTLQQRVDRYDTSKALRAARAARRAVRRVSRKGD